MPKLLQVAWAGDGGGLERIVHYLAEEASSRGWGSIVAYCRREPPPGSTVPYLKLIRGRYGPWPIALAKLIRKERPDIVHLHGPVPGSTGAAAARMARAGHLIYTDHFVHSLRPRRYQVARRLTSRLPSVNVAVSQAVADSLIRDAHVGSETVTIIMNGTPVTHALRSPTGEGRRKLLYVANLSPWKGHLQLVRAVGLVDRALDFEVNIVGKGPLTETVRIEISRLGLTDRVKLLGYMQEPWQAAEGAWAYLHPSYGEGLPLALLEAMMRGLPVIATRTAGIPEVVRDRETGLLVDQHDAVGLAGAITEIIVDADLRSRLAVAARDHALSRFPLDRMLDGYFDLYESLVR